MTTLWITQRWTKSWWRLGAPERERETMRNKVSEEGTRPKWMRSEENTQRSKFIGVEGSGGGLFWEQYFTMMHVRERTSSRGVVLMCWTWWLQTEKESTGVWSVLLWHVCPFFNVGLLADRVRSCHSFGVPSLFSLFPSGFSGSFSQYVGGVRVVVWPIRLELWLNATWLVVRDTLFHCNLTCSCSYDCICMFKGIYRVYFFKKLIWKCKCLFSKPIKPLLNWIDLK